MTTTSTNINEMKIQALAIHLDIKADELNESSMDNVFEYGNQEYMVCTDREADAVASEYIKDSLWAFNADFLSIYCNAPIEAIQAVQNNGKCEDNNSVFEKWIEDMEGFISDAISADGRGHFISYYDGHENEETVNGELFFIYRIN